MDTKGKELGKENCIDLGRQLLYSVKVLFATQYKNKNQKLGYCTCTKKPKDLSSYIKNMVYVNSVTVSQV